MSLYFKALLLEKGAPPVRRPRTKKKRMRLFCENDSTSHPPFPTQVRQPITKGIGTVRLGRPRDPACRTADNGLCRPKAPDKGFGGRCRLPWRVRSSRGLLFRLPNEPSQGSSAARLEKTSMIRLFVAKIFLNIERFSEPGRHGSYRGEYGDRDSEKSARRPSAEENKADAPLLRKRRHVFQSRRKLRNRPASPPLLNVWQARID